MDPPPRTGSDVSSWSEPLEACWSLKEQNGLPLAFFRDVTPEKHNRNGIFRNTTMSFEERNLRESQEMPKSAPISLSVGGLLTISVLHFPFVFCSGVRQFAKKYRSIPFVAHAPVSDKY